MIRRCKAAQAGAIEYAQRNRLAMHYSGRLRYTKANGSTTDISGGYAACCSGRQTIKLAVEGRVTLDWLKVTCKKCLSMMKKGRVS